MRTGPDVVVVGAGVVGLSIAFHLVQRGASVTVFDRPRTRAPRRWRLFAASRQSLLAFLRDTRKNGVGMKVKTPSFGSTALHYLLAYAVALPIFLFFVVLRRLLARRRGPGRRPTP